MHVRETIVELREKLQAPRKTADTWYGRNVMRQGSVYLTRFALERGMTPNQVTLLSLISALLSFFCFSFKFWLFGIVLLNLWYLLDHVDGEIARYSGKVSLTGYFFDTVINYLVQPGTFVALALGLSATQPPTIGCLGFVAVFGAFMLGILPLCEDSIRLATDKKLERHSENNRSVSRPGTGAAELALLRKLFSKWHLSVTFPSVLLSLTLIYGLAKLIHVAVPNAFRIFLFYYAASVNSVWIAQLVYKIRYRTLDISRS